MTPACTICGTRIDAVWYESGYRTHVTCEDIVACQHGEPRGPRYCAICRKANCMVIAPDPRPAIGRNTTMVAPSHPETAQHAANRVLPLTGSKRRMVIDAIMASIEGLCDWQLERLFRWKHESASACRRSLVKDGWLMDSGRTRPVPDTGNPAIVWVLDGQLF
jgi:hypothetical protein